MYVLASFFLHFVSKILLYYAEVWYKVFKEIFYQSWIIVEKFKRHAAPVISSGAVHSNDKDTAAPRIKPETA